MIMSQTKKVVILDNHPVFLRGMEDVLFGSSTVEVIMCFSATKDFWEFLAKKTVDLVLVDLRLADTICFQVLKQMKESYPETKVIVLSSEKDAFSLDGVLALGGDGYVLKEEPLVNLFRAIHNVLLGECYVPHAYLKELVQRDTNGTGNVPNEMSPQELVIFGMICDGHATKEIASVLFISPYTVNNHRKNIIKKTGCKTTIGMFKYAMTHGLL
jgi:DNA-binding NarL/FixJ family response regulator